jgi:hypothetical protein
MAGTEAVEQAHELYRGGRHREALQLYTAALAAARGPAQRIALHSNRAACYLKLHDFHKVSPLRPPFVGCVCWIDLTIYFSPTGLLTRFHFITKRKYIVQLLFRCGAPSAPGRLEKCDL